ncbi:amidase [Enhydrobacter aerosaccus]|uniref:Indoleacetamide hydrolase n=1 Tax=Enhydrobacter aerosaccus TaxID=225324 RepID=A0A1T4TGB8_9HYPH|nr:amidase [Enhydrobacter aerosaccus]SKA39269.1 amidase [Enhydrobacter aerosaccus]
MPITRPTTDDVMQLAEELGMSFSRERAAEFLTLMQPNFDAYDVVDALPDNVPRVKYPRTPGYRPGPAENKYGAWYYKSTVKGAAAGKLAGKTVVLKDNVSLAGVPMMNGASTLEGFVPVADATIVTRMLDAGATIVGKSVCEHFCLSGGSHTSDPGPVHNPRKMGYSAGGSSSGSAALVAAGEVDMAIGGDQGGSIRIPSSFCGIYGMKATHGLVPYTGVMPIEATIDHTGPMTATVKDNALLLEVLAGPDGLDPRQYAPKVSAYTEALDKGVKGLKIGILKEAFLVPGTQPDVADKVKAGAERFRSLGATVEEVSIPEHPLTAAIWGPIGLEGLTAQMMLGNGMGFNWKGYYDVGLIDAHSAWRERADDLSDTLKLSMLVGLYGLKHYRGRYYAKAQNIARVMKAAYDAAFASYDLLLSPTLPLKATPLPAPGASLTEYVSRAFEMIGTTSQFDVTGHPAMSIPCGLEDGLPIGLMLIAKDYDESMIYRAAAAFEASGDWKTF